MNVSPGSSTVTSGLATRLWNQAGLVGAPPFDAITTRSSPVRVKTTGVVRVRPDLAPVVVSKSSGAPLERAGDLAVVGAELLDERWC